MVMSDVNEYREIFGQNMNFSICKKVSFLGSGLRLEATTHDLRKFGMSPLYYPSDWLFKGAESIPWILDIF